jgi:MEDS: MEthanogen/methylotroph, DcmR Sensory domain
MGADGTLLRFAGGTLSQHRHICAFFNGVDEQRRVLRSFVTEGFDHREKAFHLVDPECREDHLRWLAGEGVDLEGALGSGQLEVRSWWDGPLRQDRFDKADWIALLEQVLLSGSAAGYARTRFLAQMEWALADLPGTMDLIEFETQLNHVVRKYDDVVICAYDLARFGASVVIDALRTHPVVIIGGLLHENPFFVPPEEFLAELRARRFASKPSSAG